MPFFTSERNERGYFHAFGYRFNTSARWWGTAITSVTGPHPLKWWKRITVWESKR
jgi:hypothetical protein